ncbi:LacI family DNA-binding transcriptional regulator [Actinomadura viridis]|uniref:LacI family DNA-binding transcriptional regulator n=1 Tax=Actinomadura viridis TaxID=58110 RepID=UPI0036B00CDE
MSEGGRGGVTIVDVARAAQVSTATASRALGGYGRISAATRERILAVADELGYRPNDLARAVRVGRSSTIGLVVTDLANPFFAQATRAVVDTASALGYEVLIANTGEDAAAERRAVRVFAEKRVRGLVVVPSAGADHGHLFRPDGRPHLPLVLLDRRLPGRSAATVISDDLGAAREAVGLLAGRGHTAIGMIDGNSTVPGVSRDAPAGLVSAAADRVEGFLAGLRDAGLEARRDWMLYATAAEPGAAEEAALALLGSRDRPTAVVANNSDVALAVVMACNRLGLAIGRDVALIGFDDASWTRAFTPAISVVARPVAGLGEAAVRELAAQMAGRPAASEPIVLPNRLVDRPSAAPRR